MTTPHQPNRSIRSYTAAFAAVAVLAIACPAAAIDLFVVDAKGIALSPGQQLDGGKVLALADGQRVTFVTGDGRTLKLKGPYDAAPAPEKEASGSDVMQSLKGLIAQQQADTSSAGVIRGGVILAPPPSPWLVAIHSNGDRCLLAGDKPVLWHPARGQGGATLEISPLDHSWSAKVAWPGGSDRLALPAALRLNDGQAYAVHLDQDSTLLTIHMIPRSVRSDAARTAWMVEMGCLAQANALLDAMR